MQPSPQCSVRTVTPPPKTFCGHSPSLFLCLDAANCHLSLQVWLLCTFLVKGISKVWSLHLMSSIQHNVLEFIQVVVCTRPSFFLVAEYEFILWTYCPSVYSLTDGHLGCFQVWNIINKFAINLRVQVF